MRWRCVDHIEEYVPWQSIRGIKSVSFEEGSLLRHFGRENEYSASLLIEGCVELARWLAAASSEFSQIAVLDQVESFQFTSAVETGDRMTIVLEADSDREDCKMFARCRVVDKDRAIAGGRLQLTLLPMNNYCDPDVEAALWGELYDAS